MTVLLILIFTAVSLGLLAYISAIEQRFTKYDTRYIKGAARGYLGMFEYRSILEEKRLKLNRENSKF